MRSLLGFFLPPLIGALIGFVTNVVAVRMLFRPLKEIRLLRFRLPFTPGILPRERHKLAESIGAMVDRELLTAGVLRERLARPELREKVEITLGSYTAQMLERPLSQYLKDQSETAFPVPEITRDFINSEVFDSLLEEIIKTWATGKEQKPPQNDNGIGFWLKSRVRDFSTMLIPAAKDMIKTGIVREIKNYAQGEPSFYRKVMENLIDKYPDLTLREFLSLGEGKKRKIDLLLADKTVTTLDDNLEEALGTINVKTLVTDRIDSLDMLRVEKIVLDVMAGQLKWINVFGGVLGALIGFAQVILSLII